MGALAFRNALSEAVRHAAEFVEVRLAELGTVGVQVSRAAIKLACSVALPFPAAVAQPVSWDRQAASVLCPVYLNVYLAFDAKAALSWHVAGLIAPPVPIVFACVHKDDM